MPENAEPKFIANVKKYALFYGAGGVAALQALKIDIFSFPPEWRVYLGYFFSMVTLSCIFLGGNSIVEWVKQIPVILKKLDAIKKNEAETKEETKS